MYIKTHIASAFANPVTQRFGGGAIRPDQKLIIPVATRVIAIANDSDMDVADVFLDGAGPSTDKSRRRRVGVGAPLFGNWGQGDELFLSPVRPALAGTYAQPGQNTANMTDDVIVNDYDIPQLRLDLYSEIVPVAPRRAPKTYLLDWDDVAAAGGGKEYYVPTFGRSQITIAAFCNGLAGGAASVALSMYGLDAVVDKAGASAVSVVGLGTALATATLTTGTSGGTDYVYNDVAYDYFRVLVVPDAGTADVHITIAVAD